MSQIEHLRMQAAIERGHLWKSWPINFLKSLQKKKKQCKSGSKCSDQSAPLPLLPRRLIAGKQQVPWKKGVQANSYPIFREIF